MHAAEWIAAVGVAFVVGGPTLAAVVRLTRLVDAVERLNATMVRIVEKVDDHEDRLRDLEQPRGRR